MRVVVDFDACEANARCMANAPEVFLVDDEDSLHLLQEHPPESLRAAVERAVDACPKGAISLVDEANPEGRP
jgi:ferredoxin